MQVLHFNEDNKENTLHSAFLLLQIKELSPPEINDVAQSHTGELHHTQDQDPGFKEWLKDLTQNYWKCLLEV